MCSQEVALEHGDRYPHFYSFRHFQPTQLSFQAYEVVPKSLSELHPPFVYYPDFENPPVDATTMETIPPPDDMEQFQKLSNEYEPDLQGPLVGPRQSTDAIVSEYAQGDPIYVAKTSALAGTHSYYRIMKGDGNCGWRAVAFGYFENLLHLRDINKVAQESARIKSFNSLMNSVGHQEDLYEMFVDASLDLLEEISKAIEEGNSDDTFLLNAFNVEYNSTSIIQHFRLMTSAWMRLNRDRYQAFLAEPLEHYCQRTIEPVKTEIDEIGLQGLVDGVITDSGFAVQIAYLDRSQGDEVNFHLLTPDRPSLATVRLLYRPGHYDLLYQTEPPASHPEIPVNYQIGVSYSYAPWYPTGLQFDLNPTLMSIPALSLDAPTVSAPLTPPPPSQYIIPPRSSPHFHPPMALSSPHSFDQSSPHCLSAGPLPTLPDKSNELPIRMNPLVREPMNTIPLSSVPFRNSQHNQAHFQNPDFQPSQWDYTKEYK
ncbi:ubiquitin thioesterase [Emydomyces testavorans]|uniref:ubiquitinyl hydrolase 1 n=1 Tax=Emydomyces testavorans TaxID=2070801 RepID=A0AAF0DHF0_9EURO|nr:ubiquitin thioesterase [Emydomyces testavorans]